MNNIKNFKNYKFRASAVGNIMTGVKIGLTDKQKELLVTLKKKQVAGKITDKQLITLGQLLEKLNAKPKLSQGAKTYLEKLFKEEYFGKRKEIETKYMDKGIYVEEKSITLYSKVTGTLFFKNEKRFENEYLTGTPDTIKEKIIDIKSSWNLDTFPMFDEKLKNDVYKWQVIAYMELTGLRQGEIAYCLVDTPEHLILDEIRRFMWKNMLMDISEEQEQEIRKNLTFSDIPEKLRVKRFEIEYKDEEVKAMRSMIKLAREYMNELKQKLK